MIWKGDKIDDGVKGMQKLREKGEDRIVERRFKEVDKGG